MKDQNTIIQSETKYEKWDRAKTLLLESLLKPDNHLRSCSHNQQCYDELMQLRDLVIDNIREWEYSDGH